jgi:hypothetical protein
MPVTKRFEPVLTAPSSSASFMRVSEGGGGLKDVGQTVENRALLQLTLYRGRWANGFGFSLLDLHVEKQIGHDDRRRDHLRGCSSLVLVLMNESYIIGDASGGGLWNGRYSYLRCECSYHRSRPC